MNLKSIALTMILSSILTGCATTQRVMPAAPKLNAAYNEAGDVVLTRDDAVALGEYIEQLRYYCK